MLELTATVNFKRTFSSDRTLFTIFRRESTHQHEDDFFSFFHSDFSLSSQFRAFKELGWSVQEIAVIVTMTVNSENSLSTAQSATTTAFGEIPLQHFNTLEDEVVFWKTLYVFIKQI